MNTDIAQAKVAAYDASDLISVAITSLDTQDVDKAEVKFLEAINRLTAALVDLRNYRVA